MSTITILGKASVETNELHQNPYAPQDAVPNHFLTLKVNQDQTQKVVSAYCSNTAETIERVASPRQCLID